jgi:hypothetical protein
MITQFILSTLLLIVALYAQMEYRRSPAIGLLSMLSALTGLYFVWIPGHATDLAEFMGIGRGADLILYLWVVISLIVLLNLHLKLQAQMEVITVLVRQLAISNARVPQPRRQ